MKFCRLVQWVQRSIFMGAILLSVRALSGIPYGLDEVSRHEAFLDGKLPNSRPQVTGNWSVVPAFPNLKFTNVLGLAAVPGTNQLVVWEREGRVWLFNNDHDVAEKRLIVDISDRCQGWQECGLFGLAFHPGFVTNHFVFLYYMWVKPGTVVGDATHAPPSYTDGLYFDHLARFTLDANLNEVPDSELTLVHQLTGSVFHNGGGLFFHPENGFLYWTDGDDVYGATQTISQGLLSGIFRIDVDMQGGEISHAPPRQPVNGTTANYFIPNDNPFVGQPGVLEEFYALGLRNPFRATYDPPTRRIFLGDVGLDSREELDVIEAADPAGLNFQWNAVEGDIGELVEPYIGVSKPPVLVYNHTEGRAVIGGYVYRGQELAAELGGKYIFGDNVSQCIWYLDETTIPATKKLLTYFPSAGSLGLSGFGVDANQELYLYQVTPDGAPIYKLARSGAEPAQSTFPLLLSQTGVFDQTSTLQTAEEMIPYGVNSPLWSDGAVKSRWLAVPKDVSIDYSRDLDWNFPVGTVFVKHFELAVDETSQNSVRKRLETRILVRGTNGAVFGATYKWRADNSDADLLPTQLDEEITIKTASGVRTQVWHFPSRDECLVCHNSTTKGVLGVSTRQLNGDFGFPTGVTDNQLRTWNHLGLFSTNLEAYLADESLPALVSVTNQNADLQLRVRSYLDANCSFCHQPGGVRTEWDARITTPLELAAIINGSVSQKLGLPGAKVVAPGHPERSVMLARGSSTDAGVRMPPLARNEVDVAAMSAISDWIQSLSPAADTIALPWLHDDIGLVGSPGAADYSDNVLSLESNGFFFWDHSDATHFVYQPLSGDGEIVARLTDFESTQDWAQSGLMIRESLSAGARESTATCTPLGYPSYTYRPVANASSYALPGPDILSLPAWLRLVRSGTNVLGYYSQDGSSWILLARQGANLPNDVYIGFAVSSHDPGLVPARATFDNVRVAGGLKPLNYAPRVRMTTPLAGTGYTLPAVVQLAANASDADGSVTRVEFYDGVIRLAEMAAPPYGFAWTNPPVGKHQLTARVTDQLGSVTTSEAVNISTAAVMLGLPKVTGADNGVQLSFTGLEGVDYVLYRSSNLVNWTPIATNSMSSDGIRILDVPTAAGQYFYRVQSLQ
ncbi:MAG TPA: PQQ-dependent sugar dehydrogenase [Candidatus Limnocylindria bacterium]|nr:PQQ-dependent sugar dehydrogenase [Candidatus Limnocylindria bacterium]